MNVSEPNPLITPQELASDPEALVFDCRFSLLDSDAGRRAYEAGHIPGAVYADMERDLSRPGTGEGRHPLPDRNELAAKLAGWGVNRRSRIVCYDQNSGAIAGRLWWLVRWLGHASARVLDGGLDAWIAAGLATTTETVQPVNGDFNAREPLTRTIKARELPDPAVRLLDAREAERYRGDVEPIDPVAGHIPGAISAPFVGNLENGYFKSADALTARFKALGVSKNDPTVCYCGSGITATHNILALKLAGWPEPALYAGSWSGWITDPTRPIATGCEPGG